MLLLLLLLSLFETDQTRYQLYYFSFVFCSFCCKSDVRMFWFRFCFGPAYLQGSTANAFFFLLFSPVRCDRPAEHGGGQHRRCLADQRTGVVSLSRRRWGRRRGEGGRGGNHVDRLHLGSPADRDPRDREVLRPAAQAESHAREGKGEPEGQFWCWRFLF